MGKIVKGFAFSVDGLTVTNFEEGECNSLPKNVLDYAKKNNFIEGEIEAEVEESVSSNSNSELLAEIDLLNSKLAESEGKVTELTGELSEAEAELEKANTEIKGLGGKLEKANTEIEKLKADASKKAGGKDK